MKKRVLFLITCVLLEVSTLNVYGGSFNMQSPGMEIFNVLNEEGLTKQEVEEQLGVSDGSEKMFHSVYDYSLGGVDGELKVRYDDAYLLCADEPTDNIDENTQVGRLLWKEKNSDSEKIYKYQMEKMSDLNSECSLEEFLNIFSEVPSRMEKLSSEDFVDEMVIEYRNYPMYGEMGILRQVFSDDQTYEGGSWRFELSKGKKFSDYSFLICNCWLKNLKDLLDSVEIQDTKETDDYVKENYILALRTLSNYYLKVFKEKDKREMKIFESALKNLYLIFSNQEAGIFEDKLYQWEEMVEEKYFESDEIINQFMKIWKTTDECKLTWDQIIEQDDTEYHWGVRSQLVHFLDKVIDENKQIKSKKCIIVSYDPEEFDVENLI